MRTLIRLLLGKEERRLIGFQRSQCVIESDGHESDSSDFLSDGAVLSRFKDEGHLEKL